MSIFHHAPQFYFGVNYNFHENTPLNANNEAVTGINAPDTQRFFFLLDDTDFLLLDDTQFLLL